MIEPTIKRYNSSVVIWLFCGCFLVFAMVVVGGITRLTGSGLSITEWNVIMGSLPPLNESDWNVAFEKYQASPQFKQQNFHFNLEDFKNIFWWEYFHRIIGRLIGVVFVIPFLWFLFKRQLEKKLIPRLIFIFLLGGLQGFLGWYMVKSGLVDNPRVSHYRLALHLVAAFITFGFIFWSALNIVYPVIAKQTSKILNLYRYSVVFFILVFIQIIYGAFTAGQKAGHVYNTFPKMNDEWIAVSVKMAYEQDGLKSLVENMASIQFVHRMIAYVLVIFFSILLFKVRKLAKEKGMSKWQAMPFYLTGAVLMYQFLLGIFTLLFSVPLALGVFHQMGAFFLFSAVLFMLHRIRPNQE